MAHKLTHQKFRQMVEEQGQALLDALAFAAHGDLDVPIDIPEGIDVLTDLAIGFDFLLDDLRILVQKQKANQELLEQRVAERTQELEEALAEMQSLQRRYIEHEWTAYTTDTIIGDVDLPESWTPTLETAVSRQQAITHTNGESTLALPVRYGDEVIGLMGFGGDADETGWDDNDLAAVEAIAEQVGLALENQRLFDQTQAALNESSSLYEASARLNAAETYQDILDTLAQYTMLGRKSHNISLNLFDKVWAKTDMPEYSEVFARITSLPKAALSPRYRLADFPEISELLHYNRPTIIEDVEAENFKQYQTAYQLYRHVFNAGSTIFVPLSVGTQWIGYINAIYPEKTNFPDDEVQRILALAGQAAVAVSNKRLLANTQERAAQLETLSRVEVALSQANSEKEILQALMHGFDLKGISGIELNYLSHQPDNSILLDGYGFWSNGRFLPDDVLTRSRGIDLKSSPITSLWENNPNTITYVEDITKDDRANDPIRQHAQKHNWQAAAIMPLRRGGDVLAMVWITWKNPHPFTNAEEFVLAQLLEPISAVVSSRRAQLAQQEALAETASLYRASAEMNAAQTYDSILSVVRKYTVVGRDAHSISFNIFEHPWTAKQTPEWATVLASYSKQQEEDAFLLPRYSLVQFTSNRDLLRADEPVVIKDFDNPPVEIDEATYNLYVHHHGAKSAVFAPLVVGGQWIGFINARFKRKTSFSESHIRRLASIAGQAAVAIQNIALLEQTQQQLENLTAIQQTTADLSAALTIDEAVNVLLPRLQEAVRADKVSLFFLNDGNVIRVGATPLEPGETVEMVASLADYPLMAEVATTQKASYNEVEDPKLQDYVRDALKTAGVTSIATIPLIGQGGTFGVLSISLQQPDRTFAKDEIDLLTTITSQVTIAFQRIELLEQARAKAQREQMLREITSRVRGSADVDTIMKTAVQEIGRALGRKTYIYLDSDTANEETTSPPPAKRNGA